MKLRKQHGRLVRDNATERFSGGLARRVPGRHGYKPPNRRRKTRISCSDFAILTQTNSKPRFQADGIRLGAPESAGDPGGDRRQHYPEIQYSLLSVSNPHVLLWASNFTRVMGRPRDIIVAVGISPATSESAFNLTWNGICPSDVRLRGYLTSKPWLGEVGLVMASCKTPLLAAVAHYKLGIVLQN